MEVVLNSYIARLVLSYLEEANLKHVSDKFCKYSPYLQEELEIINKGLRPVHFGNSLVSIIKDYCNIKCKLKQAVENFPPQIRDAFQKQSLIGQLTYLLKIADKNFDGDRNSSEINPKFRRDFRNSTNIPKFNWKRKCEFDSETSSQSVETTKIQELPGYSSVNNKKRRISGSFQFIQDVLSIDSEDTDEEENQRTNNNYGNNVNHRQDDNDDQVPYNINEFLKTKENIKERLLENTDFHNKLADNINKARILLTSTPASLSKIPHSENDHINDVVSLSSNKNIEIEIAGNDSQLLDDMIQNVLNATEKDPTFNEVVEDVLMLNKSSGSKKLSRGNQSLQKQFDITKKKATENETVSTNEPLLPPVLFQTPRPQGSIIFRTSSSAATNSVIKAQSEIPAIASSSNSLIPDSNLTTSKFFVVNSGDSNAIVNNTNLMNSQNITLDATTSVGGYSQLFLDFGNGQTFPFFISNEPDGLNYMVVNNDGAEYLNLQQTLSHQQQSLTQQLPVQQEQLEPNLLKTAKEQNETTLTTTEEPESSSQCNEFQIREQETTVDPTNIVESSSTSINLLDRSMTLPADSKIQKDKETPVGNGTLNLPSCRSLSTPRRKSSHVRILNFSPMLKTNDVNRPGKENSLQSKKPLIESVQILPKLENVYIENADYSSLSQTQLPVSTSKIIEDNSNSNSTNPDQNSNLTVIHTGKIILNGETPKRKTDPRRCKRVISRSNSEEEYSQILNSTQKTDKMEKSGSGMKIQKKKTKSKILKTKKPLSRRRRKQAQMEELEKQRKLEEERQAKLNPLEAWDEMRQKSVSANFDQYLREIAANTPIVSKEVRKQRQRRKKSGSSCKKHKSKNLESTQTSIDDDDTPKKTSDEHDQKTNVKENKIQNSSLEKKGLKFGAKINLLNFKIKTPKKRESISKKTLKNKIESTKKILPNNSNNLTTEEKQVNVNENKELIGNKDLAESESNDITDSQNLNIIKDTLITSHLNDPKMIAKECQKRTSNIACLLETPFKIDTSQFPATPRFLAPSTLSTPSARSITNTSMVKHIDIQTPSFAITPGSNLTPMDKETPLGANTSVQTDYSSGGSYYWPDESEDLCKKLDRELDRQMRDKRLRIIDSQPTSNQDSKELHSSCNDAEEKSPKESFEEIIENEPITDKKKTPDIVVIETKVLERVKSFNEDKHNDVIPHYKFAAPLSTEPSTSSSSSSSSSDSDSDSSSSSSSSSSKSLSNKLLPNKIDLSDINSSEDENWDVASCATNPLLNSEGEVRFPVRSWITPMKLDSLPNKDSKTPKKNISEPDIQDHKSNKKDIKIKFCIEKFNQRTDLEEKRQRMKAKLIEDEKQVHKFPQTKFNNIRIKKKSSDLHTEIQKQNFRHHEQEIKGLISKSPDRYQQMDVLTALNLSAKKKPNDVNLKQQNIVLPASVLLSPPKILSASATLPASAVSPESAEFQTSAVLHKSEVLPSIDDNAISDIFSLKVADESNESLKMRDAALALTTLYQSKKKRLTVQIDPQPIYQKNRGRPKKSDRKKTTPLKLQTNSPTKQTFEESLVKSRENFNKTIPKKTTILTRSAKKACVLLRDEKRLRIEKPKKPESTEKKYIKFEKKKLPLSGSKDLIPSTNEKKLSNESINIKLDVPNNPMIILSDLKKLEKDSTNDTNSTEKNISRDEEEKDEEEEDPYQLCEKKSSNENLKNVFDFNYSGSDEFQPNVSNSNSKLNKFSIKFCIDNGQRRHLSISKEIVLFKMKPKTGDQKLTTNLNKPEKIVKFSLENENIGFNSADNNAKRESDASNNKNRGIKDQNVKQELQKESVKQKNPNSLPAADISEESKTENSLNNSANETASNEQDQEQEPSSPCNADPLSKNIRNEDIYAVLSLVHGKENK